MLMQKTLHLVLCICLLFGSIPAAAARGAQAEGYVGADARWHETEQLKQHRLAWWKEAKFGKLTFDRNDRGRLIIKLNPIALPPDALDPIDTVIVLKTDSAGPA